MKIINDIDKLDINKLDINKLLLSPLKVSFVKKDYIRNFKSDYEKYLTEFINCSKFVSDNGNKQFIQIQEQSNGESDATNGKYTIDYKLLMDSKTIENMYYYSEQIRINKNGGVIYSQSRKSGKWRRYIFPIILKGLSKKDIEKIENSKTNNLDEVEKLVKNYIKNIKKDKNIIYFIPFNLYFKDILMNTNVLKYIGNILAKDLKGFFEYRNAYTKKDTYISFISKENIVFYKYEQNLILYDIVNTKKVNCIQI